MFENIISNYKFLKKSKIKTVSNIEIKGILLSNHNENNLEIVISSSSKKPNSSSLRSIWKDRKGGTATPLLVICSYNEKISICGPLGDEPPVYEGIAQNICEVIILESLEKTDDSLSLRTIKDMLSSLEQNTSGIKNEGLFSNYVLSDGAKRRSDWDKVKIKSKQVLGKTDTDLLSALGYEYDSLDSLTYVLKAAGKKKALGILLKPDEMIDTQNKRFGNVSPITHAFNLADRENLPFVIICSGQSIRIYSTDIDMGVGRKGRTETYVHCQTNLLTDEDLSLLWLIYSSGSINSKGSFYELLEESKIFSGNLAKNLRERIYNHVVPNFALAIADGLKNKKPTIKDLQEIYSLTMLLLFRILFIAYAEDKDLLPYKSNDLYKKKSLKNIALEIKEINVQNEETQFTDDSSYWDNLKHIFFAINNGNKQWGVPIYNGGLFSLDQNLSPLGERLNNIKIKDKYLCKALYYLLLIEEDNIISPIDFRSLGVREFGTIYEGLLDGALSFAEEDYDITSNNILKPSNKSNPEIKKGSIYLHNKSGERKSSGSYYTKSFVVNHLVEKTLSPQLDTHFEKLNMLSDEDAGDNFFNFKIADIAMGSGHFLITAIDVAEIKFSNYLSDRKIPKIINEIKELRLSAEKNLGNLSTQVEIEDSQLLRRLIARRCIYGVDQNFTAVQLARLAIWIHTFVPGLPLSFLDHNLVVGNSLIGIGNLEEVKDKFYENESSMPLLFRDPTELIKNAIEPLEKLASLADSTIADIKKANLANREALESIKPAKILCDIITAARIEKEPIEVNLDKLSNDIGSLFGSKLLHRYKNILDSIEQFHFPIAFPEVFLRENSGFDVILGNPPWEEATIEENAFWARYFPGLRGLAQRDQEIERNNLIKKWPKLYEEYNDILTEVKFTRKALISGDFPGMGKGDPDLYKAFCWRFWKLINNKGKIGIVLPRNTFLAKGSEEFRKNLISGADNLEITFLINTNKWIFDEVHGQYLISLSVIEKNKSLKDSEILIKGPINSYEKFKNIKKINASKIKGSQILSWNDAAMFPTLPKEDSLNVFLKFMNFDSIISPKHDWIVRLHTELHATNDKKLIDLKNEKCPEGYFPVYKGESFNTWDHDTKIYYGWGNPEKIVDHIFEKRKRSYARNKSPFSSFSKKEILDKTSLPCFSPRIAFRDVTNSLDTKTIIASLVPPNIFLANQAPYLLFPKGSYTEQIFILGFLNSIPLDWYSRRFVDKHLSFFIFESLTIPKFDYTDPKVKRIIEITANLSFKESDIFDLQKKLKIKLRKINDNERNNMIAELDCLTGILYGLNDEDLSHIFKTYRVGWDFDERLNKVKSYYKLWNKK